VYVPDEAFFKVNPAPPLLSVVPVGFLFYEIKPVLYLVYMELS